MLLDAKGAAATLVLKMWGYEMMRKREIGQEGHTHNEAAHSLKKQTA